MAGRYYEELTPGLVVEHSIRRTVSEYDNTLFSAITHNLAPLHLDEEYSKTTLYGGRIIYRRIIASASSALTPSRHDANRTD